MLRTTIVSRTAFPIAAAAMVTLTACQFTKDDTGGRPDEPVVAPVTVTGGDSGTGVSVSTPPFVKQPGASGVAVALASDVSYKDGESAFRDKRYVEATRLFSDYTLSHPESSYGQYMLGLSAWKSGDVAVAEASLNRAVKLDPKNVKAHLNLGRVLLEQDRAKEARKPVTSALKLDSTSAEVHRLMGRVHSSLKENDEAIVSFRLALKYNPGDAWSMNNMALIMIQQQRYSEALGPLARAVQLDSGVAVFHNNLGIVLEHTGQFGLATLAYQKALSADSGYTKALMRLARIKGLKDDPTRGVLDLAKAGEDFDKEVRGGGVSVAIGKK